MISEGTCASLQVDLPGSSYGYMAGWVHGYMLPPVPNAQVTHKYLYKYVEGLPMRGESTIRLWCIYFGKLYTVHEVQGYDPISR